MVMGLILLTPSLVSQDYALKDEDGHCIVKSSRDEVLNQTKSLCEYYVWLVLDWNNPFWVCFYLVLDKIYAQKLEYFSLQGKKDQQEGEDVTCGSTYNTKLDSSIYVNGLTNV